MPFTRYYSESTRAQEDYFRSLIEAFATPTERQDTETAQVEDPVSVAQPSARRRRDFMHKRLLLKSPEGARVTESIEAKKVLDASQPVATLVKPSTPLKLPKSDTPLGLYEHPGESLIPISSVVHHGQTLTESIQLVRNWFQTLDLNTLTAPVPTAGNLAPYVPRSHTLQQLALLGVDLSKIELIPGAANMLIRMDFHRVIEPMLWTLYDLGFNLKQIAHLLTRFPKLLKLSITEVSNRFAYFLQHGFTQFETVRIITAQPLVLHCTSVEIDRLLGQVQTLFGFSASDVRLVVNTVPGVLLHPLAKIKDTYVVVTKMFGFAHIECKQMACSHPKILVTERERLVTNFAFMHTRLDLPLECIQMWPEALTAAPHLLPQRATFLVRRGLFQPDPTRPLYTPLNAVVNGTDQEFCTQFGHTTESDYDTYLKTL